MKPTLTTDGAPAGRGGRAGEELAVLDQVARVLTASGEYRVLRRFRRRDRYAERAGRTTRVALFVDVETTGLNAREDAIIEFGAVPFVYGVADGAVYAVGEAILGLEDPGRPIPTEVSALTGITDEMVRDRRLDDVRIEAALAGTALVIAHNAAFDRPFIERRLPAFAGKPWACSLREVDWERFGFRSTKLDWLLMAACGEYHDNSHRADADCLAGIHLLATPLQCGTRPMQLLLASCRAPTARVWAVGAPYAARDALKARRYRWSPGEHGGPRAWYTDVSAERVDAECAWLAAAVYGGARGGWRIQHFGADDRYSERV